MKIKSFKQYTTESSLGHKKHQRLRGRNPGRERAMQLRNQVRATQAGTRSFQSGNSKEKRSKEKRRENSLIKQGEPMGIKTPLSDTDIDRAIDLETDNRRAMSSNMRGKRR